MRPAKTGKDIPPEMTNQERRFRPRAMQLIPAATAIPVSAAATAVAASVVTMASGTFVGMTAVADAGVRSPVAIRAALLRGGGDDDDKERDDQNRDAQDNEQFHDWLILRGLCDMAKPKARRQGNR